MARIGLFGGTFNPIHIGHMMIAEEARIAGGLDRVVFIPTGESYMKDPSQIVSREDRLEMVRLAVNEAAEQFEASDIEVRREGPSYTAETLEAFRRMRPDDELFLILGADSLLQLEHWRRPEQILRSASILAMARGGIDIRVFEEKALELIGRYGASIRVLNSFALSVSSSQIRNLIREGHAFRYLIPESVYRYIVGRHLYGDPRRDTLDGP